MQNTEILLLIGIIIGLVLGFLISKIGFLGSIKSHRKEAINKAKYIISGQINEKIAPLLPNFKYNFKDLVFIGKGIDYIVFDGLSLGECKKIIFLEIKTGKSNQNQNEKSIQNTINKKNIAYEILKI